MFRGALVLLVVLIPLPCSGQSFHKARAAQPEAGSMFVFPERIRLKSGEFFTATRGQMFVPLNRNRGNSDVISVEFYLFPRSEKANPDTPPLFLLNGGPGFPGLQDMLDNPGAFEQRLGNYLEISDLVVVGQRGIGSSKPDTVVVQPRPPMLKQARDPANIESYREALRQQRQFWIDQGVDLSGFTAVQAAADVYDIAKGLGFDKIMITGGSFGSHWGMTVMRKHPEIVARALLHGMEGPDHTWDHPGWIWNVYKRVARDAEASDRLEGMIPDDGLIQTVEEMVGKAEANPVTVTVNNQEIVFDGDAMRAVARGYSRSLRAWPAEVIEMSQGRLQNAARRMALRMNTTGTGSTTASYWMLDSSSGITAKRQAEFESDPAMKIIGSTFDQYRFGSPVWEADLGDDFRQNFRTQIPTVIVHGTWDLSTPYENAVELAPFFENGTFVTVERGSHGALGEAMSSDRDFSRAVFQFMSTGDASALPEKVVLKEPRWKVPRDEDMDE